MTPFITFREIDADGNLQYYVLQRQYPHFVSVLWGSPKEYLVQPIPISGYNLWLIFSGTIIGNWIPAYPDIEKEIMQTMENMARWYYTERILKDEKRYKKFKIQ